MLSPNNSIHAPVGQMGHLSVFQQRAGQGNKRKERFYLWLSGVKLFWIRVIKNSDGKSRLMSFKPRLLRHGASLLTLCSLLENCLGLTWMPLKRYQTTTTKCPSVFSQPDHSRFSNRRTNIPQTGRTNIFLQPWKPPGHPGARQGTCPGAGSHPCCPAQAAPHMICLTHDTK